MRVIEQEASVAAYLNTDAASSDTPFSFPLSTILNEEGFEAAQREISLWPGYQATPLHFLPTLAAELGMGALYYKDESFRFNLKSFKALGGAYAVLRVLEQQISKLHPGVTVSAEEILSGQYRQATAAMTVTCATDGNHGRSVAWGAKMFGCRCVIYVHATVSQARVQAIEAFGAEVVRVPGNYDDSVRHAAEQARRHGWTVVSDTTYAGYRDIPIDVMHGYGVMAREVISQLHGEPPTHVIVQAGVGALAASVCAVFWQHWQSRRPRLIVVEPEQAACFFQSGQQGRPVAVPGELDTVMAGLACGEVSPLAWDILRPGVQVYSMVGDDYALEAMCRFAQPKGLDPAIVSGETGAAGLALLLAARKAPHVWQLLGLDQDSRVLLVGSEGDTDASLYEKIVGKPAGEVLGREF